MDQRSLSHFPAHPFDADPTAGQWDRLTIMPEKRQAFAVDVYFREAWADLVTRFGDRAVDVLLPLGLLVFKPDAVVGRRMRQIVAYLSEHNFELVGLAEVSLSRLGSRELWRYNWNFATLDRIHLSTRMYAATDTLLLMVRDRSPDAGVPGTVRLSALKGPAAAEKRAPHHLRDRLQSPHRLINFVHVADEPADIAREVAILLDQPARAALFDALAQPRDHTAAMVEALDRLEERYPQHDLDFESSLLRRTGALGLDGATLERLRDAAGGGRKLRLDELTKLIPPIGDSTALWDFICLGCWTLVDEREGYPDLLPSVSPADWAAQAATLPMASR